MTPDPYRTWNETMALISPFTPEERFGFLVTLRQIRALPEVGR